MNKKYIFIIITIMTLLFTKNVFAKEGWVTEEDKTYYYVDDEKITSHFQVDDNSYFFDEEGVMQTGFVRDPETNKLYFYSRVNGALKYGWQGSTEGKWYQNENGEVLTGHQIIDENKYYFNDEGILQTGFVRDPETNKLYFYSRVNGALKYGWQGSTEGKWYQNENGELLTGHQTINNDKYYFNDEGILQTGFVRDPETNKLYFYSRVNGALKYGWQGSTEGKWYQNENGELLTGHQTINNDKYYFNDEGILQTGFVRDPETNKLYFYSRVNGTLKYGWQGSTEGKWYQNENGEVLTGRQTISNDKYYFNDEGIMQTGFVTDPNTNKKYFYSNVNGKLKTGWQYLGDDIWYQNSEGELVTGSQKIEDRDYVFNETTGFLDGFKYENGKKYYYNPDGTLNMGIQYMAGRFWKFNETTGVFEKFVKQIRVIDISHHNGDINWDQVKASGKVDAVILRLGYGDQWFDNKFFTNKAELERLGIPYSIYLFSYAENRQEAIAESNFVINSVKNHNINIATNIFSIYYDLESWVIRSTGENSYGISKDTYGEMITAFVDNVERNLCIKTRVYASEYYVYDRFPDYAYKYATWIANWTNAGITYPYYYEGWQFTSRADVPGIPWGYDEEGNYGPHTDMSIFYY